MQRLMRAVYIMQQIQYNMARDFYQLAPLTVQAQSPIVEFYSSRLG